VPTLKEYLQICKQYNKYAVLELKGITQYASLKKVVDTIQETGMSNQTVLISFHLGWLENVYTSVPGGSSIPMLALYQNALTAENYTYLSHTGFSGVDQYWKVATTAELQACQKAGLAYGVWTITTTTSETTASSLVKQDMNFVTLNSDTVAKSVLDAASEQSESQAKDETKNPVDSSGTTDSSKSNSETKDDTTAPITDPDDDSAGTTQISSTSTATK
jgi:glycerophosphoryl diester phosphodiesterase